MSIVFGLILIGSGLIRLLDHDLVWVWRERRNERHGVATERTEYADEVMTWSGIGRILSGIGMMALAVIIATR